MMYAQHIPRCSIGGWHPDSELTPNQESGMISHMKYCGKCKQYKDLSEFYANAKRPDGKQSACKACKKKVDAEYFQRNKKKIIDNRYLNRDKIRASRYKISVSDLNAIQDRFGGKCWVCLVRDGTDVDHCHSTGKVRGWLCGPCNRSIGVLGDNANSLSRVVDYLNGQLGLLEAPPDSGSGA